MPHLILFCVNKQALGLGFGPTQTAALQDILEIYWQKLMQNFLTNLFIEHAIATQKLGFVELDIGSFPNCLLGLIAEYAFDGEEIDPLMRTKLPKTIERFQNVFCQGYSDPLIRVA